MVNTILTEGFRERMYEKQRESGLVEAGYVRLGVGNEVGWQE